MRAVLKKERRTWVLPEPLRAQPGLEAYSPVFRQILHGRSVTQPRHLDPWLVSDLGTAPDPFLLKDMALACDLIGAAVRSGRRIAVYGALRRRRGDRLRDPRPGPSLGRR